METWKRKRTQYRREFTCLADKTEKAIETKDDGALHLFELLSETASSLFEAEEAIRDVWCAAEDFDEAQFEADQDKSMLYKLRWHKVKSLFSKTIQSSKVPCTSSASSLLSAKSSQIPKISKQRLPTLPKLELIKFDGNIKSWLQFWGQFKKIHNDTDIDSCDKFQYLLQSMAPNSSARQLVESYPPCAENYDKAIAALKARFARDDVLIETYVRGLLTLMQRKEVSRDLSSLYDNIQTHLQALETLGVTNDKYASMLFPMIESALPEEILRAWHRSPQDSRNLTKLMGFLKQEVESEERIRLARREYDEMPPSAPQPPTACFITSSKPSEEGLYMKSGPSCIWCSKENHSAIECHKAAKMTLEDRIEYIKSKKACLICLKSNHVAKKCRSFPKCLFCKKRHFTIMCADIAAEGKNNKKKLEPEKSSSLHCELNTTTLLQTVVVQVASNDGKKSVRVRALIDSGAQRSYIRKDLVEKLDLKPAKKEFITHCLIKSLIFLSKV